LLRQRDLTVPVQVIHLASLFFFHATPVFFYLALLFGYPFLTLLFGLGFLPFALKLTFPVSIFALSFALEVVVSAEVFARKVIPGKEISAPVPVALLVVPV
jgi:hypothetical protein